MHKAMQNKIVGAIALCVILSLTGCSPKDALSGGTVYAQGLAPSKSHVYDVGTVVYPYRTVYADAFNINGTSIISIANITGPQGPPGVNGTNGATGAPGPNWSVKSVAALPIEAGGLSGVTLSSNTQMSLGLETVIANITVNQMVIYTQGTVTTPGTYRVGVYSEDGQTKIIDVATPTMSAINTPYNITLSPSVTLTPGNYYFAIIPVGTSNMIIDTWATPRGLNLALNSKPVSMGLKTGMTAGTLPASFDPTTITFGSGRAIVIRLDN